MSTLTEKKALFKQLDAIYDSIESIDLDQLEINMRACGYTLFETSELLAAITMPHSLIGNVLPGLQADIDEK